MQTKTKMSTALLISLLVTACSATSGGHTQGPTLARDSSLGTVMTDKSGMTLYTFTKDSSGVSNCNDACAATWPPFAAREGAQDSGKFSVMTRADGSRQWAYEGKPLYTWQGDQAPGDVTGHGVGGVWFTVKVEQTIKEKSSYSGSSSYY